MDVDTKPCPVCGEAIKLVALKCRFCNTDLTAFARSRDLEIERELFSGHPALFYSMGQLFPFVIAAALAFFAMSQFISGSGIVSILLSFVVVSAFICLSYYFKSLSTHYRITTQRIMLERGLLSKVKESLELFRIDHFELRKPLGMRLLGQASLHLFSSDAELERFSIYGIPNLESIAELLRECQLRERARRGLATFIRA